MINETEKEKAMHEQEICCEGCGGGLTAFEHQAASTCAKCGRGPYCSRCGGNHAENCQKPFPETGYTCKICDKDFADLRDYTMHATTCVRPDAGTIQICESCKKDIPLDQDAVFKDKKIYCLACWDRIACGGCYELFGEEDEVGNFDGKRFHLKCQPVRPQEPSKVSDNYYDAKTTRVDPVEALFRPAGSNSGHLMPDSAWLAKTPEVRNQACHEDLNKRLEELEVRVEPDAAVQSIHARSISALEKKAEEPKVGGNLGDPGIDGWFDLRAPTEEETFKLDSLSSAYKMLAKAVVTTCPENPERVDAIWKLKESMQTAISSIVCADAWQTPKGD